MRAIAASSDLNHCKLFLNVILASCSIPGLFPHVPIEIGVNGRRYTELHADENIILSLSTYATTSNYGRL